jgi:predicted O-linked N-acetylglucosamine transferase (SPINDLY family)
MNTNQKQGEEREQEQEIINTFYSALEKNQPDIASKMILNIINNYSHSYILMYYAGLYFEKVNNISLSIEMYRKSIDLQDNFAEPYLKLFNILAKSNAYKEIEDLSHKIYGQKVLDPTSLTKNTKTMVEYDIQILSILEPYYSNTKQYTKLETLFKNTTTKMSKMTKYNFNILAGWKNIYMAWSELYRNKYNDLEKVCACYYQGLEGLCGINYDHFGFNKEQLSILKSLDISLYTGYALTVNYLIKSPKKLSFDPNILFESFRISHHGEKIQDKLTTNKKGNKDNKDNNKRKIKIGYVSPDFNKNAVGLFLTSLFKYYSRDIFEIYVYYTIRDLDEYTFMFKQWIPNWYNISMLSIDDSYHLIKNIHQIDILVDLITIGGNKSVELILRKPAPIIINYLGFPDYTGIIEYDYRLVDYFTDPTTKAYSSNMSINKLEKTIRKSNCFICYTLFETIQLDKIPIKIRDKNTSDNKIYLGIMNKYSKQNSMIRNVWENIIKRNKNCVLCVKYGEHDDKNMSELYKNIPHNQIRFLSFTNTLEEYLEQFNMLDICLDTFPYSGTTTTCSSLLMGVPVFTIWNTSNYHVSNVSASIIKNVAKYTDFNLEQFICNNLEDYEAKINHWIIQFDKSSTNYKNNVRQAFLQAMDPVRFMKEYEDCILSIIK